MAVRPAAAALLLCVSVAASAAGKAECHDHGPYRIVARPAEGVGTDFLVKRRVRGRSIPSCAYQPRPGDLEIRNQDAEYFLGVQGDFLVLDSGTAPEPRGLVIWNLETRARVYTGRYSQPLDIDRAGLSFWQETGVASEANCPQFGLWRSQHLGAAIETQVRLDFDDLVVVPGAETRCSPRQ